MQADRIHGPCFSSAYQSGTDKTTSCIKLATKHPAYLRQYIRADNNHFLFNRFAPDHNRNGGTHENNSHVHISTCRIRHYDWKGVPRERRPVQRYSLRKHTCALQAIDPFRILTVKYNTLHKLHVSERQQAHLESTGSALPLKYLQLCLPSGFSRRLHWRRSLPRRRSTHYRRIRLFESPY